MGKNSIKSSMWFMQIQRLPSQVLLPHNTMPTFAMHYRLKEKKQKAVMRIGKRKDKESGETRVIDGVTRLICLSKGQSPLKVYIDGCEWSGVKFFQLSSLWQTHIKHFPVATITETTNRSNYPLQISLKFHLNQQYSHAWRSLPDMR